MKVLEDIKVERVKMSRTDRAKQFAPFDALKGLQDALRIKEYQHERVQKGEVDEEKADEISKVLMNLEKGDIVCVKYFENGHYLQIEGRAKLIIEENVLQVDDKKINLDDMFDISNKDKK